MLHIEVKGNIEKALKTYKSKVIKTKMINELQERKEFTKKSVKRRAVLKKAAYKQKKESDNNINKTIINELEIVKEKLDNIQNLDY